MSRVVTSSMLPVPWRTATAVFAVSVAMFAFGYAMVPLYYTLCKALGIDTAQPWVLAQTAPAPPRPLRVEFDANSHNTLVSMVPAKRVTGLTTGTAYSLTYEIANLTDEPVRGLAVPSFSPAHAARWFTKLQCFCFAELVLEPRETLRAPVVFLVEQDMPDEIATLSLSYTFFPQGHPQAHIHDHAGGGDVH